MMSVVLERVFATAGAVSEVVLAEVRAVLERRPEESVSLQERARYLRLAVQQNRVELVRLLADGPQINVQPYGEESVPPVLFEAVNGGSTEIIRVLVDAGVDVGVRYTDESLAESWLRFDIMSTDLRCNFELTSLQFALIVLRHPDITLKVVRELLSAPGIDVNGVSEQAPSPIMLAGVQCHLQVFDMLLDMAGVDLSFRDHENRSVLDFAAVGAHSTRNVDCLMRLVSHSRFDEDVTVQKRVWICGRAFDPGHGGYKELVEYYSDPKYLYDGWDLD